MSESGFSPDSRDDINEEAPLQNDLVLGGAVLEASQKDRSVRAMLVRKLNDIIVLPAGQLSSNERSLVGDILLQILDKVEIEHRIDVAIRVARVTDIPTALVRMILLDDPEVACPYIERAESIPEALLIEAAREGGTAHREKIARRIDLTASLADVVIEHNEAEISKLLLLRDEFVLSPFAIEKLVSRSTTDDELQGLLLRRRELEPAHGFMMFWWVNNERRKRILTRFSLDRSVIQNALEDLYPRVFRGQEKDPFVKDILVLCERRHRPRGLNGEPVDMSVVERTLSAAREYPSNEIIDAVGMVAGISRELASRVLRDPGGEAFAVLCKSLSVPRAKFWDILGGDALEGEDLSQADNILETFDSMARDFARAVLRYWDWDGNPRIARITRLLSFDVIEEE